MASQSRTFTITYLHKHKRFAPDAIKTWKRVGFVGVKCPRYFIRKSKTAMVQCCITFKLEECKLNKND